MMRFGVSQLAKQLLSVLKMIQKVMKMKAKGRMIQSLFQIDLEYVFSVWYILNLIIISLVPSLIIQRCNVNRIQFKFYM